MINPAEQVRLYLRGPVQRRLSRQKREEIRIIIGMASAEQCRQLINSQSLLTAAKQDFLDTLKRGSERNLQRGLVQAIFDFHVHAFLHQEPHDVDLIGANGDVQRRRPGVVGRIDVEVAGFQDRPDIVDVAFAACHVQRRRAAGRELAVFLDGWAETGLFGKADPFGLGLGRHRGSSQLVRGEAWKFLIAFLDCKKGAGVNVSGVEYQCSVYSFEIEYLGH